MNAWRLAAALGVVALGAGCASLGASRPIEGRVVDAETGRGIAGAVVRLDRWLRCRGDVHGQPVRETATDASGVFRLADPPRQAPCVTQDLLEILTIAAPGYLPESGEHGLVGAQQESPRADLVRLAPIRYRSELDVVARRIAARGRAGDGPRPGGPLWTATVAAIERQSVRAFGASGVFASRAGAAFDRVAIVQDGVVHEARPSWLVLAQDRAGGAFFAWTRRGEPVPETMPGARDTALIGGEHHAPIVAGPGVIHLSTPAALLADLGGPRWFVLPTQAGTARAVVRGGELFSLEDDGRVLARYDLNLFTELVLPRRALREPRAITPAGSVALAGALPGLAGPAACMFDDDRTGRMTFVAPGAEGPTIFHMMVVGAPSQWRGSAVSVEPPLSARATACTSAIDGLYVALDDGRLVRLRLTREGEGWRAQVAATARVARPITSLAVGALGAEQATRLARLEVVYAVTGDDAILRFTADLRPDERIEIAR